MDSATRDILREEFERFISLFEIDSNAFEYFYHLCTDGEITWENIIDKKKETEGIIGVNLIQPETYEYYIDPQGKKTGIVVNSAFNPVANYANPINVGSQFSQYNVGTAGAYQPQSYSTATSENTIIISFGQLTHVCTGTYDHTGLICYPVLEKARVAYRQLSTIESACIIYRLVRAPERLVFNVDTGTVSPTRAEQIVNKMMERFNVKHVWDAANGTVATNYDPMSMLECLDLSTKIPLLDGRTLTLSEIIEEFKAGKQLWAYSASPTTGKFSPGKISWAGITRRNAKVVKVTFDNGKSMIVTPDHRFPVWKKGKVEAMDLKPNDSIIAFNTKTSQVGCSGKSRDYMQVFDHEKNDWVFVHNAVAEEANVGQFIYNEENCDGTMRIVHHKNMDRFNRNHSVIVKMHIFRECSEIREATVFH